MNPTTNPGWYPDPLGHHQQRWWDGSSWTAHVSDHGVAQQDPLAPARPDAAPSAPAAVPSGDAAVPGPAGAPGAGGTHAAPGWFPDPLGHATSRWWDGRGWTTHVASGGATFEDALVATGAPTAAGPFVALGGAGRGRRPAMTTWLAIAAVVALVIALVVVLVARSGSSGPTAGATTSTSTELTTASPDTTATPARTSTVTTIATTTVTSSAPTTTAAPTTARPATTVPFTFPAWITDLPTAPPTPVPTVSASAATTTPPAHPTTAHTGATTAPTTSSGVGTCTSSTYGWTAVYPSTWFVYAPQDATHECELFSPIAFTASDDTKAVDEAWVQFDVGTDTTVADLTSTFMAAGTKAGYSPASEARTVAGHGAELLTATMPAGTVSSEAVGMRLYAIDFSVDGASAVLEVGMLRPMNSAYDAMSSLLDAMVAALRLPSG